MASTGAGGGDEGGDAQPRRKGSAKSGADIEVIGGSYREARHRTARSNLQRQVLHNDARLGASKVASARGTLDRATAQQHRVARRVSWKAMIEAPQRAERKRLSLPRALGLSFTTVGATFLVGCGAEALAAHAWTWVQLAIAGVAFHLGVGLLL